MQPRVSRVLAGMAAILLVASFVVATNFQTLADGFKWAVTSPQPAHTNTCKPAVQAACEQILESVEAAVVIVVANQVVYIVTH